MAQRTNNRSSMYWILGVKASEMLFMKFYSKSDGMEEHKSEVRRVEEMDGVPIEHSWVTKIDKPDANTYRVENVLDARTTSTHNGYKVESLGRF